MLGCRAVKQEEGEADPTTSVTKELSNKTLRDMKTRSSKRIKAATAATLKTLGEGEEEDEGDAIRGVPDSPSAVGLDLFPAQMEGGEEAVSDLSASLAAAQEQERRANLFKDCWFFFSREVCSYPLPLPPRWRLLPSRTKCPTDSGTCCHILPCIASVGPLVSVTPLTVITCSHRHRGIPWNL